jgi:predicted kinase
LDRSFWNRADREEFRAMVEKAGARWVLVAFRPDKDVLWRRIRERRQEEVNADSSLDISEELFERYVKGFEMPGGEGEIIIDVV